MSEQNETFSEQELAAARGTLNAVRVELLNTVGIVAIKELGWSPARVRRLMRSVVDNLTPFDDADNLQALYETVAEGVA